MKQRTDAANGHDHSTPRRLRSTSVVQSSVSEPTTHTPAAKQKERLRDGSYDCGHCGVGLARRSIVRKEATDLQFPTWGNREGTRAIHSNDNSPQTPILVVEALKRTLAEENEHWAPHPREASHRRT